MGALIFDFDGVIADSEALANTVLAEHVSHLGRPTTLDEALTLYSGRRWADVLTEIERNLGKPLPSQFSDEMHASTLARFESDLQEVSGAKDFICRFDNIPRCIASSSSTERLQLCLRILNLETKFADNVFSADMVKRGKPFPDLFLFAANWLGVAPQRCLVIEDSARGVTAAIKAGMTVVGLCAASHIRDGHEQRLRNAGAVHLASSWAEVGDIASRFFDCEHILGRPVG